ncbi:lysophospholipid acyltransferase family protein [Marinicrinis lubricantis]
MRLKNFILLLRFALYMLRTIPNLNKAKKYAREGKEAERVAVVQRQAKDWTSYIFKLIKSEVIVHGEEKIPTDQAVVFVANHQGYLDIPIIMHAAPQPVGFIAKEELRKMPLIGTWMQYKNCIFMERNNVRQSLKAINQGVQYLKEGHSMAIFPEGTRSKGPEMGEFKPGSFKLATKARVPIVPVTINHSYKLLPEGLKLNPGVVEVTFSEPIPTEGLSNEELGRLPQLVQEEIRKHIKP